MTADKTACFGVDRAMMFNTLSAGNFSAKMEGMMAKYFETSLF